MGRLILAIFAGWLAAAIPAVLVDHIFHVTEIFPPYGEPMFDNGLLLLALSYRTVFSVAGVYLAAVLARDRAKQAAWVIGILGTIAWLMGLIAMPGMGPVWYPIAGSVTSIPLALLGLKLKEWRAQ